MISISQLTLGKYVIVHYIDKEDGFESYAMSKVIKTTANAITFTDLLYTDESGCISWDSGWSGETNVYKVEVISVHDRLEPAIEAFYDFKREHAELFI